MTKNADGARRSRVCTIVGVSLLVLAFAIGLGAVWWWALWGMDDDVGLAWQLTTALVAFAGSGTLMIGASS